MHSQQIPFQLLRRAFWWNRRINSVLQSRQPAVQNLRGGRHATKLSGTCRPDEPRSFSNSTDSFVQRAMHLLYACGAFAYRRRNALHAATANVAHGKYPRYAGFEKLRLTGVRPFCGR